jgi:hypothetical protein
MVTVGGNVRVPFFGGATHAFWVSYENGKWDAGVVVTSDIMGLSAGRMLAKGSIDVGIQKGDFCSNSGAMQQNMQAGAKALGINVQRDQSGLSGIGFSMGPQFGVEVSAQKTSTLSIRKDFLPFMEKMFGW